ncbi:MAG: hypothetical protein FJ255_07430 [Phycisphaerae bacterium]|nr:hypothetical protein [Phycisphaerae bacterium]
MPVFPDLNLNSADDVAGVLRGGAEANRTARCRSGSIDQISGPGRLIATGDLHDNPLHLSRLVEAAGLGHGVLAVAPGAPAPVPSHLVLHEVIHSDRLVNGMDFSYRALARVAALKAAYPEHVHTLLANHELAQLTGADVMKGGVRCVQAFNDALDCTFSARAGTVREAIAEFVRSMPLALRVTCAGPASGRVILCAHSLPSPEMMGKFDPRILFRGLTEDDYRSRTGSAYMMVWGRRYDAEQLEDLVERWGINLFLLGHDFSEEGVHVVPPNAVVLNSDHDRGVYLPVDLSEVLTAEQAVARAVPLGHGAD